MPQRRISWLVTDGPDATVGQVAVRTLRGRLRAAWFRKRLRLLRRAAGNARDLDVLTGRLSHNDPRPAAADSRLRDADEARRAFAPWWSRSQRQALKRTFQRSLRRESA